jgi:superfamily II DNA or RNA helicase
VLRTSSVGKKLVLLMRQGVDTRHGRKVAGKELRRGKVVGRAELLTELPARQRRKTRSPSRQHRPFFEGYPTEWPDTDDPDFLNFVWNMLTNGLSLYRLEDYTMEPPPQRNQCLDVQSDRVVLENYQALLPRLVNPSSPIKRLLYIASTGAGKTCIIHAIAAAFRTAGSEDQRVVVIVPGAPQANEIYKQALRCPGPLRTELVDNLQLSWDKPDDMTKIVRHINKHMEILTYVQAGNRLKQHHSHFNNRLILMDEVHNLVDSPVVERGHIMPTFQKVVASWRKSVVYLYQHLGRIPGATIVGFTATPTADRPEQLIMLLNTLTGRTIIDPDTFETDYIEDGDLTTDMEKLDELRRALIGHIAIYDNSNDTSRFPELSESDEEVEYSAAQAEKMGKAKVKETLVNIDPLAMRKDRRSRLSDDDVLQDESPKLYAVVQRVMSLPGKQVVFSDQKLSGAEGVLELLLQRGYKEFGQPGFADGSGIIYLGTRGDKAITRKGVEQQLRAFNSLDNKHGEKIPIAILSSKYAEGVDMKGVRAVHFVEQPAEPGRYIQVVGRARRFCSHKDLDYPGEWTVDVYTYTARSSDPNIAEPDATSRDKRVQKMRINKSVMNLAGSVSLDCVPNRARTGFECYSFE